MIPLAMLREHGRLLGFGFFMCLSSNFGQTFFISLFSADVRDAFGLSHGGFGTVYSTATIASAAVLIWAGRVVDRIPLAAFARWCWAASPWPACCSVRHPTHSC